MILDQINLDNPNRLFPKGDKIDLSEAISSQVVKVDEKGKISLLRCPYCGSKNFYIQTDREPVEKPKDDGVYITGFDMVSFIRTITCGQCESQLGLFSGVMRIDANRTVPVLDNKVYFLKETST